MTEQEFNKALGEQLRAMRKAQKRSRKDVAQHLGKGQDMIGKIERGENAVNAFDLTRWVIYLGGEMQIGGEKLIKNTVSIQQKTPDV